MMWATSKRRAGLIRFPLSGIMKHWFSSRTGRSCQAWVNRGYMAPHTMCNERRPSNGVRKTEQWRKQRSHMTERLEPVRSSSLELFLFHICPSSNSSPSVSLKIPSQLFWETWASRSLQLYRLSSHDPGGPVVKQLRWKKHRPCKWSNVKITCNYQTRCTPSSPDTHCLHISQLQMSLIIPCKRFPSPPSATHLLVFLLRCLIITHHKGTITGLARQGPPWRAEEVENLSSSSQNPH